MAEVLERGDIQFFFRPTVQPADPDAPAQLGVQSFFVVLSTRTLHRRVRIGRKRMPATTGERLWARVERIGSFERAMGDLLEDEHYQTKTRGDRYQPAARRIARGCYAFVRHDDHVHFVYRVEARDTDDIPDEVNVPDAASHVVLFERFALDPHPGARASGARGRFALDPHPGARASGARGRVPRGRATWTTEGDPRRLDEEGAELVIVGVTDEPERELGVELLQA